MTTAQEIHEICLLPPLAIARFGSSPQAIDNYNLVPDSNGGFSMIQPGETLAVNPETGEIVAATTPALVRFKDGQGRVKPVCPFFEVWARTGENPQLEPLTLDLLESAGLGSEALVWHLALGNLKLFRRAGDPNDRIEGSWTIAGHQRTQLRARAANFLDGRDIALGFAQYIKPTSEFPEIRFRFTPAVGKVFGFRADGVITPENVVYDQTRGRWDGYQDQVQVSSPTPRSRLPTSPAGIFAQRNGIGLGYLDDSCDGVLTAELQLAAGGRLSAKARVSVGPPDYAPDSLPVRSVADELDQLRHGPQVESVTAAEVIDITRRALDNIRLMNTEYYNTNIPWWEPGAIGAFDDPDNPERDGAPYAGTMQLHAAMVASMAGLEAPATSPERQRAHGMLQRMAAILRAYDRVNDYSRDNVRHMPALTRGGDGELLALTRRMRNKIVKAIETFPGETGPGETPEGAMVALVNTLSVTGATFHLGIDAGDGETLSDLFARPLDLLAYLRSSPNPAR